MFYNVQPPPTNDWPSNVQYPSYHPDRITNKKRLKIIWILALAIVLLTLCVTALIIVFAVEHSWFSDSFTLTNTNPTSYSNHYGLWRLCVFPNQTCDSWFSTDGAISNYIEQRLNQSKVGINAWQALEIVFIFLTTPALIVALISLICYVLRKSIHYYLAILAVFIIWPAVCVGIAGLFVFGFSVYNVAQTPRNLDWCFYVNLVAVILSFIAAILLTIYAVLLKKPIPGYQDEPIVDTFTDINGYPATLDPSSFVVVKPNKKKRAKSYHYQDAPYPDEYYSTRAVNNVPNTDYIANPNYRMIAPYTSGINNQQRSPVIQRQRPPTPYRGSGYLTSPSASSIPPPLPRYYPPPPPSYPHQSAHWHRTGRNPMNYNQEPVNDYIQRGIYRPPRLNPNEHSGEPRVLHYYTGYDHFATVDSRDVVVSRQYPSGLRSGSPVRYPGNSSYYHHNDYLTSAM